MTENKARLTLRITQEFLNTIKASAENNNRSALKEIEAILNNYLKNKEKIETSSEVSEKIQFSIRLPQELYSSVKDIAKVNKRDAAKEIEFILDQHYHYQNVAK